MRIRNVVAGVLFGTAFVVPARTANAFCRTVTCKLPPSWNPTNGCYPPEFASGCASSTPPGAKVVPVWWRNACVSYDVQKNASRWVDYATAAKVVDAAFATWTAAMCPADATGGTGVSLSAIDRGPVDCDEVRYNSDAPNQHVIVFRDTNWPYTDAGSILGLTTVTFEADTGEIYDADTEINGTLPLSVGDPVAPNSYDLESVITHEMGHFLGLAHSSIATATMYARYTPGSVSMRSLTDDDVAGICSIYPPNATRSVDPSVAANGSISADSCDSTPRHGFSSQCTQSPKSGCAIASGDATDSPVGIGLAALASIGIARRRRRAPSAAKPT